MVKVRSEISLYSRIGFFGGTFNPIHFGHLRAAEEVRQALALDLMVLMPSARPPHKGEAKLAPAELRMDMVRLARRGNHDLVCSAYECSRPGASYTAQTLKFFAARMTRVELFFVLGWDAWAEIGTWYEFPRFFSLANFVVISRQGRDVGKAVREETLFPFALQAEFCYEKDGCYRHSSGRRLIFMPVTRLDISSSLVRREAAAGRSLRYLVPGDVADYIQKNKVYI